MKKPTNDKGGDRTRNENRDTGYNKRMTVYISKGKVPYSNRMPYKTRP